MSNDEVRKEVAWRVGGLTDVPRARAWLLLVLAFAAIVAAPAIVGRGEEAFAPRWRTAWQCAREISRSATAPRPEGTSVARLAERNRAVVRALVACEDRIDDAAPFRVVVAAPFQSVLTTFLETGNEQVVVGRNNWWYFRPALDSVTGRGFLTVAWQHHRAKSTKAEDAAPHTNPVSAIAALARALHRQGTQLIVVPVPVKVTVHPERLIHARAAADLPLLRNASFSRWLERLREAHIEILDLGPALATLGYERPAYLERDTHWTPAAMQYTAGLLARHVAPYLDPSRHQVDWSTRRQAVAAPGDLTALLGLTRAAQPPHQSVEITRIFNGHGQPWRPDPEADVLLLGDSFTNIYSAPGLGWGTSAGLAEHLSLALGRTVDRLVQNDAGAYATREALGRLLTADPARLAAKRVVVYQFAERELSLGDWRPVPGLE